MHTITPVGVCRDILWPICIAVLADSGMRNMSREVCDQSFSRSPRRHRGVAMKRRRGLQGTSQNRGNCNDHY